jgi:general secretion pathway protein D
VNVLNDTTSKTPASGRRLATIATIAMLWLAMGAAASAQQATITPNYKEADIRQIIEAVGAVTGKNFILDQRVNAKVTMLSSSPMSPEAFYYRPTMRPSQSLHRLVQCYRSSIRTSK